MEKASKMIKATASETQVNVSMLQKIKQNWDQHLTKKLFWWNWWSHTEWITEKFLDEILADRTTESLDVWRKE